MHVQRIMQKVQRRIPIRHESQGMTSPTLPLTLRVVIHYDLPGWLSTAAFRAAGWPLLIFSCLLTFLLIKLMQIYCSIYTTGNYSTHTHPMPGYYLQDFLNITLAVATTHKERRCQLIAFANHSNHKRTTKHCNSHGAPLSTLTTGRFTVNL